MQQKFEPNALLRAITFQFSKLQRSVGTEIAALIVAVLAASLVYLPMTALYRKARMGQTRAALLQLAKIDQTIVSSVTNRTGRFAFYLTPRGAPKTTLYGLIDVGDVEGDARKLKQALTEHLNSTTENASDRPGTDAAATGELKHVIEELIGGSLGSTIRSKFFGPEQFVSYILTLWIVLVIADRWRSIYRERKFLDAAVLRLGGERLLTPDEADEGLILPQVSKSIIGQVLRRAMERFAASRDAAAAEAVVRAECDSIAQANDTSLAMVRYVIWAVPSIGFIGTVRGMGSALAKADSPENLPDVVGYLAVAFDTTLVALLLCLGLMLLSHQFQRFYEEYVLKLGNKCESDFIRRLYVPRNPEPLSEARH